MYLLQKDNYGRRRLSYWLIQLNIDLVRFIIIKPYQFLFISLRAAFRHGKHTDNSGPSLSSNCTSATVNSSPQLRQYLVIAN